MNNTESDAMLKDAIFQWNMTSQEAEVFAIACLYDQEFRKQFGSETDGQTVRRNTIPKRKDPRKSDLFFKCWRLRRETRGLLELSEYKNYIHANLLILKLHKAYVAPNAICGDKAWIRYKVWKRKFEQKLSEAGACAPPPNIDTINPKIIAQIDKTKKFLFEKCDGQPTLEKMKAFHDSTFLRMWVATGKISEFYVLLSPFMSQICDVDKFAESCNFSASLFREKINHQVKEYFQHEFAYESSQ